MAKQGNTKNGGIGTNTNNGGVRTFEKNRIYWRANLRTGMCERLVYVGGVCQIMGWSNWDAEHIVLNATHGMRVERLSTAELMGATVHDTAKGGREWLINELTERLEELKKMHAKSLADDAQSPDNEKTYSVVRYDRR